MAKRGGVQGRPAGGYAAEADRYVAKLVSELAAEREQRPPAERSGSVVPAAAQDDVPAWLSPAERAAIAGALLDDIPENTRRARRVDWAYLCGWCRAATGRDMPMPPPVDLVLKFLVQQYDIMPWAVFEALCLLGVTALKPRAIAAGEQRAAPAPAVSSVDRRLSTWRWAMGIFLLSLPETERPPNALESLDVVKATKALRRQALARRPRRRSRPIIQVDLDRAIGTCRGSERTGDQEMRDLRDRALLLVGWASGGRRRSELAGLRLEQLEPLSNVRLDPNDPASPLVKAYRISLGRTKTTDVEDEAWTDLVGEPAEALDAWIEMAGITFGSIFRGVRGGRLMKRPLSEKAVNDIVKRRCRLAGLDPRMSAHGLRAGYLTQASQLEVSMLQAMQRSQHKSLETVQRHYVEGRAGLDRASRLYRPAS